MCDELLLLCGDFNIHMDVPSDTDTIQLKDLLISMGLVLSMSNDPRTYMATP